MNKRDTEKTVNEIWIEREKYDKIRTDARLQIEKERRSYLPQESQGPNQAPISASSTAAAVMAVMASNAAVAMAAEAVTSSSHDYSRKVRAIILSASDIETLLPPMILFDEFVFQFLVDRFGDKSKAVEFAYNFVDALNKYSKDSDCKLFALILSGKLSEEVRHDQIQILNNFEEELQKEEQMIRGEVQGKISIEGFMRVLKRVFPSKGEVSLKKLEKVFFLFFFFQYDLALTYNLF